MPGITLLKYYSPPDFAYPDEVSISNISQAYFQPINPQGLYFYFQIGMSQPLFEEIQILNGLYNWCHKHA